MTWVRWGAVNYAMLLGLLVAGPVLLIPAALVGWDLGEPPSELMGSYVLGGLLFPFTGMLYLAVLALVTRRSRRPRLWAVLLTPLFWAAVPILALGVVVPGIAALWVVIVVFGFILRLPPARRRPS